MDTGALTSGGRRSGGDWPRMWEVFHGAAELEGGPREAYLAAQCGGDSGLRTRVERLLAAHQRAGADGFLEPDRRTTSFMFGRGAAQIAPESPPARIGHYLIRERIGEGGFAEVFLATQTEPVRRDVAVKLLRPGLAGGRVLARFDAERQTLAVLQHPNIATIFDAGIAEHGRPYFVMEHIAGRPITRYCDEHMLGIERRLDLFERVCAAVQHAHHKGIIHRDLKPSNVLVTEVDGSPAVKVIDFGIARAIDQTEPTAGSSEAETVAGTPGYMSPEQAETGDVDTRTDVFSLGVMLYELLTGAPPFDLSGPAALSATLERARITRLKDAPAPTARVLAGGSDAARRRGLEPRALARRLRGDLDAIVLKSLERDRARRYGSPAELAADLARHLGHQPVWAAQGGRAYRAAKFVRRRRTAVAMTSVLIVIAGAGVLQLADTARTERRLRAAAVQAQTAAERDAKIAKAVNEFLTADIIGAGDPRRAATPEILLRDAIDAAEAKVGERFKDEPVVEAAVRQVLGDTYRSMAEFEKAVPNLERAVALFNEHLGEEDLRSLNASNDLAIAYTRVGRPADAEPILRRVIELHTKLVGPEDRRTLHSLANLGTLCSSAGRFQEAERILLDVLGTMRRVLGESDPDTMLAVQHLGSLYLHTGRAAEAEPLLRAAYEHELRIRGSDHPYTLTALGALASVLEALGRLDEALPLHQAGIEALVRRVGEGHVETAVARANLATTYARLKRFDEAEPLMLSAIATIQAGFGEQHPTSLGALNSVGNMYTYWERYDQAEPYHTAAADGARDRLERTNWLRGMYLLNHAKVLNRLERFDESLPRLLEANQILETTLGPKHPHTVDSLRALTYLHRLSGRPEEAAAWRARLFEAQKP